LNHPFQLSSQYYDLFYSGKDTGAEVKYIDNLLKKYGVSGNSLLEFGSGTGRHGCLLASLGYEVHGIERSETMVAASQQVEGFSCEHGDITSTIVPKKFDAVISLFHVVSYQVTNENLNAVFKNACQHLDTGGLFIFDIWYSPAVLTQQPECRIKKLSTTDVEITRIAEPQVHPNTNCVEVHYTVISHELKNKRFSSFEEIHPMRHFSLPEIDLVSEYNSFKRIAAEEWLTGSQLSQETWGACVVLRKQ